MRKELDMKDVAAVVFMEDLRRMAILTTPTPAPYPPRTTST